MKAKTKTRYVLRVRFDDNDQWSEPAYYDRRKPRDRDASMARIIGGLRTWCYSEKVPYDDSPASERAMREMCEERP